MDPLDVPSETGPEPHGSPGDALSGKEQGEPLREVSGISSALRAPWSHAISARWIRKPALDGELLEKKTS